MGPTKTFSIDGMTVKIIPDTDASSPDEDDHSLVVLLHYHRSFEAHPAEFPATGQAYVDWLGENHYQLPESERQYHVYPLASYIHSGVVLAFKEENNFPGQQWDVSRCGSILVKKSELWVGADPLEIARGRLQAWNQYLSGEVYGFVLERDGEELDSCWGFYGMDAVEEAAREAAKEQPVPVQQVFLYQYRREQRAEFEIIAVSEAMAEVKANDHLESLQLGSKDDTSDDPGELELLETRPFSGEDIDPDVIFQRVLDLSTCHMPETDPDWGGLRHVAHKAGFTIYLSDEADATDPEWARDLLAFARKHDVLLINFDAAGETLDFLPKWEW